VKELKIGLHSKVIFSHSVLTFRDQAIKQQCYCIRAFHAYECY